MKSRNKQQGMPRAKSRETVFKVTAAFLPLLLIVLAELLLRAFHGGYNTEVFIEYPQNPDYLVLNPHASKRYFADMRFAPTGNKELFTKKKRPNSLRFFVLGESTTIGYPYFHNGSFHRWLLYRLMHTWPDKEFEIINLSLTAVNSYAIKGFAEALAGYEADAVLIYVGQNEYYGAFGVASAQTIGATPALVNALLRLRQFRLVQVVMNAYQSLKDKPQETPATRMELMVGRQQIPYDSDVYRKGLRQFEYNMNATLKILCNRHIPVFFSNVVCNLKDLPPFVSDEHEGSANAMYHYREGQSFYQGGNYEEAAASFAAAKELDLLRFRAPEDLNRVVGDLCSRYPDVYYVDAKAALEVCAPHRILGGELFTDHVHPNLKGFALLAGAFYTKLSESRLLPPPQREMTVGEWEENMPVSPLDSLAGELRIRQLKAHWPFNDTLEPMSAYSLEEKLAARLFGKEADWLEVHSELYAAYVESNRLVEAARIAEATLLEYAEDPVFYEQAGMAYGGAGRRDLAAFYLKKSFKLSPSFGKAHYLTVLCLMADEPEASLPFLDYALAHPEGTLDLRSLKPLIARALSLKEQLREDTTHVGLLYEMATTYREMSNREGVAKYVSRILQIAPGHQEALALKATYLSQSR
jgi:tetratricopeptide (TPR) repeat protein